MTSRTSRSRRGGTVGTFDDPRFQVERLALGAADLRLTDLGQLLEGGPATLDHGGDRIPRATLDQGSIHPDHPREGFVRAHDRVLGVELDEAVHGGVEHEAEVFLGRAEGLVGLALTPERPVRIEEGSLPMRDRLTSLVTSLGARELVREDAHRDPDHQDRQDRRGLGPGDAV